MKNMVAVHMVAFLLVVVGGLNWGLVGLFNYNLVSMIFGSWPMVERVVYMAVGLSALYLALNHKSDCRTCAKM